MALAVPPSCKFLIKDMHKVDKAIPRHSSTSHLWIGESGFKARDYHQEIHKDLHNLAKCQRIIEGKFQSHSQAVFYESSSNLST